MLINVESERELLRLATIAQQQRQAARVALCVNPALELKGSGMRMSGGPRPFGMDEEMIPDLLADWSRFGRHLEFKGLHIFAGSQSLSGESIAATQRASYQLALRPAAHTPAPIKTLNLGGGFDQVIRRNDPVAIVHALDVKKSAMATRRLPNAPASSARSVHRSTCPTQRRATCSSFSTPAPMAPARRDFSRIRRHLNC